MGLFFAGYCVRVTRAVWDNTRDFAVHWHEFKRLKASHPVRVDSFLRSDRLWWRVTVKRPTGTAPPTGDPQIVVESAELNDAVRETVARCQQVGLLVAQ